MARCICELFNRSFNQGFIMAFKSDRHRKWYFANKKKGTLSSVPSGSGKKKKFYGKRKSSSPSNSPPHPALSGPSDWYSSMY